MTKLKQYILMILAAGALTLAVCVPAFAEEEAASEETAAEESTEPAAEETPVSRTITAGEATKAAAEAKAEAENETQEAAAEDTSANETEDSAEGNGLISLGIFKTTAYCPCYACSEGYGRHTCTGAIARANHTIAVDPRVIPYGSRVMINGIIYTAEDRGGGVRGNHIDIFYDTHAQTRQYGSRHAEVFLLT